MSDWKSVSEQLPESPGWYIGVNYGSIEPLRFDGTNWHHVRPTRDLAMPSYWRTFESVGRPTVREILTKLDPTP